MEAKTPEFPPFLTFIAPDSTPLRNKKMKHLPHEHTFTLTIPCPFDFGHAEPSHLTIPVLSHASIW
jgi:hypothetical protein